ncbi:hypothetical protein DFQ30_007164 [Apophysomyces sp. BC1015]|nr:hypothetical protein DFQ30_007164 [Apophysomyces sp. BC1015]
MEPTGNLQRILSAYYNVPSRVEIVMNKAVPKTAALSNGLSNGHTENGALTETGERFERKINMYFDDKLAYEAESVLFVKDENMLELIEKHKYGLGQIFGHTRRSPDFVLHSVGRHGDAPGASFWRDYSLTVPYALDCYIRETFVEGLFESYNGTSDCGTVWVDSADSNGKK